MEQKPKKTKGTLFISPAFHSFLRKEIENNSMQDEFDLTPTWRRSTSSVPIDFAGIKGKLYNETEQVDYEATPNGMRFYADIYDRWYIGSNK